MLTQRQSDILRLIIQNYTSSGVPVGSKTLMAEGIEASSATIRNDMKALEEDGLLLKTHSSSGRIPSAAGYRYYVDHLLKPTRVTNDDLQVIRQSLGKEFHEINEIIRQSAEILSELTSYTTFSLGPEVKDRRLTGFRIVPLNHRQIIAIVVTDKGNVESQVFTLPANLGSQDLEKMVRLVNDRLVGDPLMTVYQKLRTEIPMILHKYFQSTEGISYLFDAVLGQVFEDKIYVSGQMNLLDYEPHQDLNQFKSMFSLMRDSDELTQMIVPMDSNIHIKIGSELGNDLLQNMSMIQASYEIDGHGRGTIALLGPTSMPYSRMFGLVDVYRKELANRLADYYRLLDLSGS
ncbi:MULTISPECIES: heat-inducible transcriptional repressor HrcA [Enterococcus]|uniref:Heat-inducible transcription repressor HrcA n=1 Tax=Enterococcus thailandicus TaxID=417368 RepID=A0A179EQC0_ENTTH|nr:MULTISPECIES: heat-inducible transcriptional repressor HrcA [Enterococcus]ASZ07297.1 heat-inducible transcriptional repressor HrcA [Enterococcus thailandicus]MDA3964876.1 heat-inducible transcriptional repressor HrcA [Enterococcus thailandicus]MDK4351329.1 heat-inducible transcriptional repressor HrcA [Enterococcus thailandicus]MDT2732938.1 heat-inducible transcriptional repressor HrcA [Enterococcus thailandicus]MDT2752046.1 heat-inducible transcriptional repressor HrcA [Enterococcus thaila